jgi:hypothetical protein
VPGAAPQLLEPDTFVQALAFSGRAPGPQKQHCVAEPRRLLALPEVPVAVDELRLSGRALPPSAHSWVSGSNVVSLSFEALRERSPVCVVYRTSAGPELVVADSKRGLRLISLQ